MLNPAVSYGTIYQDFKMAGVHTDENVLARQAAFPNGLPDLFFVLICTG
jgi:hypothetical protein